LKPDIPNEDGNLVLGSGTTRNCGEFLFDEKKGLLFHNSIDRYDFVYYAYVKPAPQPPYKGIPRLHWRRARMVMEDEPYKFQGFFRVQLPPKEPRVLEWVFPKERGRWDTESTEGAGTFAKGPCNELLVLHPSTGQEPATPHYQLTLDPVD
jgi:hypothetical protein